MALPSGTTIHMSDVNVELNRAWNQTISLNDGEVRNLAGRPSGAISMSDLWGKSNAITIYAGNIQAGANQYRGFMRPNDLWSYSFGSASSESFAGGILLGFFKSTGAGATKFLIRGVDLGHNVTIQVNGVNYGFARFNLVGSTHHYECYDGGLNNLVTDAGIKGYSFTIKRV